MNRNRPLISVIIPIFKTEKYLDKCLTSVRNQSLKNIEILCVDDCSPDDSYKILEHHAAQDDRIVLFRHEKNLGLGGARNTAIEAATADYIASVDSDDYIQENMLKNLWNSTDEGLFDIVVCGFNQVQEDGKINYVNSPQNRILDVDPEDIDIFSICTPSFWNKLWRRSLFVDNNIYFPNHLYYQDLATTPRIIAKANNLRFISDPLINYLVRTDSTTFTASEKHIMDYFKVFDILLNFIKQEGIYQFHKENLLKCIDNNMHYHAKNVAKGARDKFFVKQYLRQLLILKISFVELLKQ